MERKYTAVILQLFPRKQNKKPLTSTGHSVMICDELKQKCLIEVAFFMSRFPDVTDTGERKLKEKTPKGCMVWECIAWA